MGSKRSESHRSSSTSTPGRKAKKHIITEYVVSTPVHDEPEASNAHGHSPAPSSRESTQDEHQHREEDRDEQERASNSAHEHTGRERARSRHGSRHAHDVESQGRAHGQREPVQRPGWVVAVDDSPKSPAILCVSIVLLTTLTVLAVILMVHYL